VRTIEVQGSRYQLASLMERWVGQLLDGLIYMAIVLLGFLINSSIGLAIGLIAAILYLLFQDGLSNGQSWGKKIMKTKVIHSFTATTWTF